KGITQIEAAAAAMADVEDAPHLFIQLGGVGEIRILPFDDLARGRVEAAFAGHAISVLNSGKKNSRAEIRAAVSSKTANYLPSPSSAFWKRPAWDFSALARVSNQSAI